MKNTAFLISFLFIIISCASNKLGSHETPLTTSEEPSAEQLAQADSEKLICTRRRPTGSRIGVKTCRTQAQVEDDREAARTMLRRMDAKGVTGKCRKLPNGAAPGSGRNAWLRQNLFLAAEPFLGLFPSGGKQ